ncbi:MAG: UDP-N-acetylmuramoyl-L-alanine--D-glutamate ligase [Betaproteobacteria bacterium HGW-Betaproteobacteria-8]|nr:MAG: UDP-N-acetylmuramoyl-L-alanine--D-glutamate ligase [Betaproteobacteria bacterium HGW-Betaproteobacteria-8]
MPLAIKDKRVLVLGLGDTGLSALRWLRSQGAVLSVADTRESPPGLKIVQHEMPEIAVQLGPLQPEQLAAQDLLVVSPGIALTEPAIQHALAKGVQVAGDVELFAQYRPASAKVIAVTGANGKSTVTTLVGEMCKAAGLQAVIAGNIGVPVLDTLQQPAPDVYVLELSSFQLETTHTLKVDAATVLNLSEDHMDRYNGMADYAAAKARIFQSGGVQVLNRQDVWSSGMALAGHRIISFGEDAAPATGDFGLLRDGDDIWLAQGENRLIKTSELKIAGLHNAVNALAALALCRAIGLEYAILLDTLRTFKGLPHRVEWIAEIGGVAFYDDSKGTNVGATCAALSGLPQKVVLIAGGDGKGQDFTPLAAPIQAHARAVVLIGRDAALIEAALSPADIPVIKAESLEQAVGTAFQLASPGDAVLLSPACASFDMFRNYVHRAEVFCAAVHALAANAEELAR